MMYGKFKKLGLSSSGREQGKTKTEALKAKKEGRMTFALEFLVRIKFD